MATHRSGGRDRALALAGPPAFRLRPATRINAAGRSRNDAQSRRAASHPSPRQQIYAKPGDDSGDQAFGNPVHAAGNNAINATVDNTIRGMITAKTRRRKELCPAFLRDFASS